MTYLLAKILVLLLLAGLCGAALTRWYLRRHFEEVTIEFARSRDDWAAWRKRLEERLGKPLAVDLTEVNERLISLETSIRNIEFPAVPTADLAPVLQAVGSIRMPEIPPPTDIAPTLGALASLERKVAGIVIPEPPVVDLAPLMTRMNAIEEAVRGIRIPAPTAAPDVTPVLQRISEVERQVKAIQIPQPKDVDLSPAMARLARIEETVREFRPAPQIDLGPVQAQIDETAKAVRAISIPSPKEPDLNPVLDRLQAIENRLARQPHTPSSSTVRHGSHNLLSHPEYGKPNDLKRIKGVAEVLEKMLHKIGVYYFWQIAEWNKSDIAHVDSLLTAFKGRIERDHWVAQCAGFACESTSAIKPQEQTVVA